jgi:hypothetical protein
MLNQQRARRRVVPRRFGPIPSPGTSPTSIIPYDYAAQFKLEGVPGKIVEDVISISVEGVFVAVAIGYGFEEERGRPIKIPRGGAKPLPVTFTPNKVTLDQIPTEALITGFRLNPSLGPELFHEQKLPRDFGNKLLQRVKPPEEISFLFSIVDSATGRELQDEPTHNIASLGKSNGERPFRLLAQPLMFQPRSTIRLQVIEQSEIQQPAGVSATTLFIVLYGYKILAAGCPEPLVRTLRSSPAYAPPIIGSTSSKVVPFDYVARLELTGVPKNIVETEVPINVEGGFVATALGYGLAVEERSVPIEVPEDLVSNTTFKLAELPLGAFSAEVLSNGIRIRPNFVRIAFKDDGKLSTALPTALQDSVFEPLNRSEDVSFRYTIFDSGTGRELQNQPIHNVAGLGIGNGDRPFKKFARPMIFLPRSTIRVTVQEHFGRGTLFFVFQGYKILRALSGGNRP